MRCMNWMCGQTRGSYRGGSTNAICKVGLIAFAFCINLLGRVNLTARTVYNIRVYYAYYNPSGKRNERLRNLTW